MRSLKVTLYWVDMYLSAIIGDIGFSGPCVYQSCHIHMHVKNIVHTQYGSRLEYQWWGWMGSGGNEKFLLRTRSLRASKKPLESGASKHQSNWVTLYYTHWSIGILKKKRLFLDIKLSIQLPPSLFVCNEGVITMEQVERADTQSDFRPPCTAI